RRRLRRAARPLRPVQAAAGAPPGRARLARERPPAPRRPPPPSRRGPGVFPRRPPGERPPPGGRRGGGGAGRGGGGGGDGAGGREAAGAAGRRARARPRADRGRARVTMKVLALDYGSARTGVAVSDPTGTVARPLGVIDRVGDPAGFDRLLEVIEIEDPE